MKKPTPERGEGFRLFENAVRFFAEACGGWFEVRSGMLDVGCFFENAGLVFENADRFFADTRGWWFEARLGIENAGCFFADVWGLGREAMF